MKLSISVPDELWVIACDVMEEESPSVVVQIALRHYLKDHPANEQAIDRLARKLAEKLYRQLSEGDELDGT